MIRKDQYDVKETSLLLGYINTNEAHFVTSNSAYNLSSLKTKLSPHYSSSIVAKVNTQTQT